MTSKKSKSSKSTASEVKAKVSASFDPYQIIKFPLSTEKNIRKIEFANTLVFVVDRQASKPDIKRAVQEMFKVTVTKVNLQNSFDGQKKAYVKLSADKSASDVSADLGLI